jgi:hypothetical protein
MTARLTACGEDLAASRGFHARTEAMRFGAATFARLVCALRQNNSPLRLAVQRPMLMMRSQKTEGASVPGNSEQLTAEAVGFESPSVFEACGRVKKPGTPKALDLGLAQATCGHFRYLDAHATRSNPKRAGWTIRIFSLQPPGATVMGSRT